MTLLSFADVAVDFGATTLLRNVSFTVAPGERWGIVGRNGAGKTTLFRLIEGTHQPSRGAVVRRTGLRIALLDQDRLLGGAGTVWEAAATGFRDLAALERSIAAQAERLARLGDQVTEADLARFGRDQERFAHEGGYAMDARVDAVLQGLDFDPVEARRRPLESLSGGERGRIGLAAQLAAPADLVLLDEPTNHLDLDTIAWLQHYLGEFGETVLVISHDRAFLDAAVDHVLHVAGGTATSYRGGYSDFVRQREERERALSRQVEQQRKVIAREEDFIRRNLAGQHSAQAKGRRRRLERLPRLSPPPGEGDAMAIRFEGTERSGDQVVVLDRLDVAIGDRRLVRDVTVVARRGDLIALVGPNGAGKTTLLSAMLGHRAPAAGMARLGAGVTAEWFRQDLSQVPAEGTVYESVARLRPAWGRGPVQSHLGRFGFSGDEVQRAIAVLSGGERARLALALMTLGRANLLVLDEPTNHLDVESIEVLEDALDTFEGTVLMVSHDRAFLRELATRVWALEDGRIQDYDGPFVEWEAHGAARAAAKATGARRAAEAARHSERQAARRDGAARRTDEARTRAARREVAAREAAVHAAEARVRDLETALADPAHYQGGDDGVREAARLHADLRVARQDLEEAMARWMEAVEATG